MRLTEMKQLLARESIRLTRSLGQNFMHDQNQLRRIVSAAELVRDEQVLEVGPGLGPLTELLLEQSARVTAVETDVRLVGILRQRFAGCPRLVLVHADALQYIRQSADDWDEWKLVANLPYSCASPILVELAQGRKPPRRIVVTVQLEVAQRLMAKPGGGDYGLLTLLVQAAFEPAGWFRVSAGCFYPAPAVDSACLTLHRRSEPLVSAGARPAFVLAVKQAFGQRRKMIGKLLRPHWPAGRLEPALAAAGIEPDQRAEQVGPEQFARLAEQLSLE